MRRSFSDAMATRLQKSPNAGARPDIGQSSLAGSRWGKTRRLDVDLVRGAREGIGDDATLLIDAGCVWDARTALQRARAFEPISHRLARGAAADLTIPKVTSGFAIDRPFQSRRGKKNAAGNRFAPLIDRRALDIYQVDISRNGFTEAAYVRQRVEEIGARLCNHCYTSPVTVAASLHWLSTCRDAFIFEDCVEDSPLRHELSNERVQGSMAGSMFRMGPAWVLLSTKIS